MSNNGRGKATILFPHANEMANQFYQQRAKPTHNHLGDPEDLHGLSGATNGRHEKEEKQGWEKKTRSREK